LIDTGCTVDMVASSGVAFELAKHIRPARRDKLFWGEWLLCDIYRAQVRLGDWMDIEIFAPKDSQVEDILGLPAILRANLCIRGVSGGAFWVTPPAVTDYSKWMGADRESQTPPSATRRSGGRKARQRSVRAGRVPVSAP